ncbi:TPA: hypothetical protein RU491_000444 [Staphylococcus aureus]|nr:hypothetical protein [Staphylococcus aureus]HDJ4406613.1 hypothetical protein [Staphylococcus aureus]HDL0657618.1 hypothetical protein [Staphylococcus aureus]HEA0020319.1 hypothetical protein [Staphylococcus aureus]HEA0039973.1 hypothetical protein [Staphylococcus aureus]
MAIIEYLYNFSRNKQNFNSAKTAVLSYDLTNLTNFTRTAFKNIYTFLTNIYLFIVKRYQKVRLPSH